MSPDDKENVESIITGQRAELVVFSIACSDECSALALKIVVRLDFLSMSIAIVACISALAFYITLARCGHFIAPSLP
jgi:hypothetical protein